MKKYSNELKERAVSMLIESEKDHPSLWSATNSIAEKVGCTAETLRTWHKKHTDSQIPEKVKQQSDNERIKKLEREVKELAKANEILRRATAFFAAADLDRK